MGERGRSPRVSVVMPVFNGAPYLSEAVESVLDQTLPDLELVAVDDGSEDDSPEILERYAKEDSRLIVLRATQHAGISRTLNRGWREARAEYVARLDADDIALPDRLARQVAFLDSHPSVAAVGGTVVTIGPDGRRGPALRFPTESRVIRSMLLHHNCFAHPAVTLRRSALEAVGGYRFRDVEDYDLWLRLADRFELANLPEPVILYRFHPGQLSLLALEEKEGPRLAVRAAARARRRGRPDPLANIEELTPEVLGRIDIDPREVARAVRTEWLSRAAILAEVDSRRSGSLVSQAASVLGPRARRGFEAALELRRADALLASGRPLAATIPVIRAFGNDAGYAWSRLTARLGDSVRSHIQMRLPTAVLGRSGRKEEPGIASSNSSGASVRK